MNDVEKTGEDKKGAVGGRKGSCEGFRREGHASEKMVREGVRSSGGRETAKRL